MKETLLYLAAFFTFFAMGFLCAELRRWMEDELPTERQIKRRMKQPRPRA
jgi:hypothetical protein